MRWLAGDLTKNETRTSKLLIWGARKVVNTRAFEYIVQANVNKRSRFHSLSKKVGLRA